MFSCLNRLIAFTFAFNALAGAQQVGEELEAIIPCDSAAVIDPFRD
jgi:hypothetical protein